MASQRNIELVGGPRDGEQLQWSGGDEILIPVCRATDLDYYDPAKQGMMPSRVEVMRYRYRGNRAESGALAFVWDPGAADCDCPVRRRDEGAEG